MDEEEDKEDMTEGGFKASASFRQKVCMTWYNHIQQKRFQFFLNSKNPKAGCSGNIF